MTLAITLLLVLSASPLVAQHPLVGAWQVSFPAGVRLENGIATPIAASGVLTVVAQGDSLIGNLIIDLAPEGPARPPLRLAALAGEGEATFVSRTKATIIRNGGQTEAGVTSTWTLGVRGDSLEGTVERKLEGVQDGSQGPQPVTGKRRNS